MAGSLELPGRAQETAAGSGTGGACPNNGAVTFSDPLSKPHWNGWGVDPAQHRFQPAETARLSASDVAPLKLKWAFGFPGASRAVAQPTVFGGRVFVGSQNGKVYSLDAKSGCTYWGLDAGQPRQNRPLLSANGRTFGPRISAMRAQTSKRFDALTGKSLWATKIDNHDHRLADASRSDAVRTRLVQVGGPSARSIVSLLHLSRQRCRPGPCIGKDNVEGVHDRAGSQAWRDQCGWFSTDGTFGSGNLVVADL